MAKKINSNVRVKNNNFDCRIGCTDKKNTTTFYIEVNTYISPNIEEDDYEYVFEQINKSMYKNCSDICSKYSEFVNDTFLLDYDTAYKHMKVGKKTFLNVCFYFKLKRVSIFKDIVNKFAKDMLSDIISMTKDNVIKYGFSCD